VSTFDREGIAERLRGLFAGQFNGNLEETAAHLGIEELSLRMSIDEISPHPTIEVLAAVIRVYGIDPSWLLTGKYDAGTHRSAMEGEQDPADALREMINRPTVRISQPVRAQFRYHDHN
jgi:hypothetical protein